MDPLMQIQVFFFISSVGFITLWIFLAFILFYLLRITYSFSKIMDKIEDSIDTIGDTTKELLDEFKDSILIKLLNLFLKKKKKH